MAIKIDYKCKGAFDDANQQLLKNVQLIRGGVDFKSAEAFSGGLVIPSLLSQRSDPKNKNALLSSVSAVNHDDKKPVVGS